MTLPPFFGTNVIPMNVMGARGPTVTHVLKPTPDQDRALSSLVEQGTLSSDQAGAVRMALWLPGPRRSASNPASVLIEAAGYVGGGLILGGAALLVRLNLNQLGKSNAILVLAGFAVVLIVAALLVAGGPHRVFGLRDRHAPVRRRLAGVLLAVSAGPAAMATSLTMQRPAALGAGLVGLAVAIVAYAVLPTVPGILAMATMSVIATIGALQIPTYDPLLSTLAFVGLGLLWGAVSAVGLILPRHIGLALAAAIAIVGAQLAMDRDTTRPLAYSLTFLIALGCFVGYWLERATALLAFGVVAATIAVPEAVADGTNGQLSGPGILLISGTVLVAASALGLWLRSLRRSNGGLVHM